MQRPFWPVVINGIIIGEVFGGAVGSIGPPRVICFRFR